MCSMGPTKMPVFSVALLKNFEGRGGGIITANNRQTGRRTGSLLYMHCTVEPLNL